LGGGKGREAVAKEGGEGKMRVSKQHVSTWFGRCVKKKN
jgi:hypothetical protein